MESCCGESAHHPTRLTARPARALASTCWQSCQHHFPAAAVAVVSHILRTVKPTDQNPSRPQQQWYAVNMESPQLHDWFQTSASDQHIPPHRQTSTLQPPCIVFDRCHIVRPQHKLPADEPLAWICWCRSTKWQPRTRPAFNCQPPPHTKMQPGSCDCAQSATAHPYHAAGSPDSNKMGARCTERMHHMYSWTSRGVV